MKQIKKKLKINWKYTLNVYVSHCSKIFLSFIRIFIALFHKSLIFFFISWFQIPQGTIRDTAKSQHATKAAAANFRCSRKDATCDIKLQVLYNPRGIRGQSIIISLKSEQKNNNKVKSSRYKTKIIAFWTISPDNNSTDTKHPFRHRLKTTNYPTS